MSSSWPAAQQEQQPLMPPPQPPRRRHHQRARRRAAIRRARNIGVAEEEEEQELPAEVEAEDVWRGLQQQNQREASWPRWASRPVVVAREGSVVGRARSLTDDDLEELKGCVDLGFGFSYHEIPELCGTLPALELCYSMSQRFRDEHQQLSKPEEAPAPALAPASLAQPVTTNWKISSPGDSPDEVEARLKYWAQAVACTIDLRQRGSQVAGGSHAVFAYSQTSSGNTYTMSGVEGDPGIISLAVRDLFDTACQHVDHEFLFRVSYMEIYNEDIKDLLTLWS